MRFRLENDVIKSFGRRFSLFFSVFSLAVLSLIFGHVYSEIMTINHLVGQRIALPEARKAAAVLDGDAFEKLARSLDPDDPYFEKARRELADIKEEANCRFIYAMAVKEGGRHIFVLDGSAEPGDPDYSALGDEEDVRSYPASYFNAWRGEPGSTSDEPLYSLGDSWGWLVSAFAPVFNSKGDVVGVVGCDFDISALNGDLLRLIVRDLFVMSFLLVFGFMVQRSLARAVSGQQDEHLRLKEAAEKANRAKSEFLATMSHEVRSPLNAVIGFCEIELRGDLPPETRQSLERIYQSANTLWLIINDILDISKIESGAMTLAPHDYESVDLLNDAIQLNIGRLGSKPVVFELRIKDDFPKKLHGDELRVKQILNNILSNAFKYTKEGQVTLAADWARQANGKVRLFFKVSDTGPGIRPEDMNRLFSKYTQLEAGSNRFVEGTGLGLTIARTLLKMMDGDITAESEYGQGSVFTVSFLQGLIDDQPIGPRAADDLRNLQLFSRPFKTAGLFPSALPWARVLVVDDMEMNLEVMKGLLRPYGLTVDTASSGREALDLVSAPEAPRYDLILMDHMMPEMDGVEATRLIRALSSREAASVPIIALTANAVVGNEEKFLAQGFNEFLSKPIDLSRLDATLRKWLKGRPGAG